MARKLSHNSTQIGEDTGQVYWEDTAGGVSKTPLSVVWFKNGVQPRKIVWVDTIELILPDGNANPNNYSIQGFDIGNFIANNNPFGSTNIKITIPHGYRVGTLNFSYQTIPSNYQIEVNNFGEIQGFGSYTYTDNNGRHLVNSTPALNITRPVLFKNYGWIRGGGGNGGRGGDGADSRQITKNVVNTNTTWTEKSMNYNVHKHGTTGWQSLWYTTTTVTAPNGIAYPVTVQAPADGWQWLVQDTYAFGLGIGTWFKGPCGTITGGGGNEFYAPYTNCGTGTLQLTDWRGGSTDKRYGSGVVGAGSYTTYVNINIAGCQGGSGAIGQPGRGFEHPDISYGTGGAVGCTNYTLHNGTNYPGIRSGTGGTGGTGGNWASTGGAGGSGGNDAQGFSDNKNQYINYWRSAGSNASTGWPTQTLTGSIPGNHSGNLG